MERFRPMLAANGVSEQQWRVLRVLEENGPLEAGELAARASVLAPSLTRMLRAMEERGLVRRERVAGDARRIAVTIADKGRRLIKKLSPERTAIYADIERRFGPERLELLLDLLEQLMDTRRI